MEGVQDTDAVNEGVALKLTLDEADALLDGVMDTDCDSLPVTLAVDDELAVTLPDTVGVRVDVVVIVTDTLDVLVTVGDCVPESVTVGEPEGVGRFDGVIESLDVKVTEGVTLSVMEGVLVALGV